jgi:glycosyltransferase involved in cell wall biosynthesis
MNYLLPRGEEKVLVQRGNKEQTITLCMIVKDEVTVITRALDSVKRFIDYICVVDTGSTDGTPIAIEQYLKDNKIKGKVYKRDWVNFGHNRTEAFNLASGTSDYIMTLDADEVFVPYINNQPSTTKAVETLPILKEDVIQVKTYYGTHDYYRSQFFKDGLDWRWEQPLHEYCWSPAQKGMGVLTDVCVFPSFDGARSKDSNKYYKDALIYEKFLLDNPKDGRAWFYLAQSYQDCGQVKRSLEALEKVFELDGWAEEIFEAKVRKSRLTALDKSPEEAVHLFWEAYDKRPTRAEPLYELLCYYRLKGFFNTAIIIGEIAINIPYPQDDILFIWRDIYEWKIKDDLSVCYYWVGRYEESLKLIEDILNSKTSSISPDDMKRIKRNFSFSKDKLNEKPTKAGSIGPR